MRHRYRGVKLSRTSNQRRALFKNLIKSLISREAIKTTEVKAKAVRRLIDKLMTKAKKGSLASRRQVLAFLNDKHVVGKLFDELAPRTKDRTSGFTRLRRLGRRRGDNTEIVKIEFVDQRSTRKDLKEPKQPKESKK